MGIDAAVIGGTAFAGADAAAAAAPFIADAAIPLAAGIGATAADVAAPVAAGAFSASDLAAAAPLGDVFAGGAGVADAAAADAIGAGAAGTGGILSSVTNPLTGAYDWITGTNPAADAYTAASPADQVATDVAAEGTGSPSSNALVGNVLNGQPSNMGSLATAASKVAKGISPTAAILGALASLGSAFSKPKAPNYSITPGPSTTSATLGPLFNAPLQTTGMINRTPQSPLVNYASYGMGPEQSFFSNNQITGFHGGGALAHYADGEGEDYGPQDHEVFDTAKGDHFVRGEGAGQEDNVNAKLSPGEWVGDANFISALGDGNNEEGSRIMYAMRKKVMADKGMKHTVPPKLKKSPMKYLEEARRA